MKKGLKGFIFGWVLYICVAIAIYNGTYIYYYHVWIEDISKAISNESIYNDLDENDTELDIYLKTKGGKEQLLGYDLHSKIWAVRNYLEYETDFLKDTYYDEELEKEILYVNKVIFQIYDYDNGISKSDSNTVNKSENEYKYEDLTVGEFRELMIQACNKYGSNIRNFNSSNYYWGMDDNGNNVKMDYDTNKPLSDCYIKISRDAYCNIIRKYGEYNETTNYYTYKVNDDRIKLLEDNTIIIERQYYDDPYDPGGYGETNSLEVDNGDYIFIRKTEKIKISEEETLLQGRMLSILDIADLYDDFSCTYRNKICNFKKNTIAIVNTTGKEVQLERLASVKDIIDSDSYIYISHDLSTQKIIYNNKEVVYDDVISDTLKGEFGIYMNLDYNVEKDGCYDITMHVIDECKNIKDKMLVFGISIIVAVIMLILSLCSFSRKKESYLTVQNFFDRIFMEVKIGLLFILFNLAYILYYPIKDSFSVEVSEKLWIIVIILIYGIIQACIASIFRTLIKKEFFKNLFIIWFIKCIFRLFRKCFSGMTNLINKIKHRDLRKELLINCSVYMGINFIIAICIAHSYDLWDYTAGTFWMFVLIGWDVFGIYYILQRNKALGRILKATDDIAKGNYNNKIEVVKMNNCETAIAHNINSIGDSIDIAVQESIRAAEQSIKDERLKAELITNVSHDIKTPLTSIINYVDLLKQRNIEDEEAIQYLDVLDRKSQRLKMLTEDLVEASKITTGNIELIRERLDFKELVTQVLGEFEDKLMTRGLSVVLTVTDEDTVIYADGRRTFRIIDNLLNNAFKYSMPNTRIYVELTKNEGKIALLIKNISESQLNIDAKELMERFKRGDESRTTEGSGLGLSIADSLATMQDGKLILEIDGDLFKVRLIFNEYNGEMEIEYEM